jgi:hypothetical protein
LGASLAVIRPFSSLRLALAVGIAVLVLVISAWLKPEIAPAPDKIVDVNYIGRYFARLHFLSVFRVARVTLIPRSAQHPTNSCEFLLSMQTLIVGFKYLLLVTGVDERTLYFVSYGTISGREKFTQLFNPPANEFEIFLGRMSLEAAKANGLQLKYIFLVFLPNPIYMAASIPKPLRSGERRLLTLLRQQETHRS